MLTFRGGLNRGRAAAMAASAAFAIAAIPMTSALADDGPGGPGPRPAPKPAPKPAPALAEIFVTNTAACQAATTALQLFITGDQTEDQLERQAQRLEDDPAEEQAEATDQSEDQQEHAQAALLHQNRDKACEPQPVQVSASCAAAQLALKNYNLADRTEDQAEATMNRADPDEDAQARPLDQSEDQTEQAKEQGYQAAVRSNCEPQPPQPSATCQAAHTALNAFNVKDRSEDQAEKPVPGTDADETPAQSGDQSEDQLENAQQHQLQQAVAQACGPERPDDH